MRLLKILLSFQLFGFFTIFKLFYFEAVNKACKSNLKKAHSFMYKAIVNNHQEIQIEKENGYHKVDDDSLYLDIANMKNNQFHILQNGVSYNATLVEKDDKKLTIKVNGNLYEVAIEDEYDLLLKQLGMEFGKTGLLEDIKAPMPGMVVDVKVQSGDAVSKDQPLVILEAMKMENVLKAPADTIVGSVSVNKEDKVEKNQVLITFEE